ncbi:MAG: isoprenylcysteine carboxylmethyltransferase family protein [Candidatus Bathyarchaeota archaeon]|nr:MAG: isoprenylcysteine carboxylmethyltransferase family protein [Candidatus Bathyarchaeota archaeon]
MLPATTTAVVLTLYLFVFFSINAQNIIRGIRLRKGNRSYAEVESPQGAAMALTGLGTLAFYMETIGFIYLCLAGGSYYIHSSLLQLHLPHESLLQVLGLTIVGVGVGVFLWSVTSRGRYSVSWSMPEDHRLVTWGPYRHVRHPSYLGYCLMFLGHALVHLNVIALLPLIAIPGYVTLSAKEEELLIERFGEEYLGYMETTGGFLPRFGIRKKN